MDWFEKITGFIERDYDQVHDNISTTDQNLFSKVNQKNYSIGCFECLFLKDLRNKTLNQIRTEEKSSCSIIIDDVRNLLNSATNNGSIFQVASQFNCLEMVSPDVTPEQGIKRYEWDRTQGPACSIAAVAATIYRNYFIPMDKDFGQTATRQINNLDSLTEKLAGDMNCNTSDLWSIKNGYVITNSHVMAALVSKFYEAKVKKFKKVVVWGTGKPRREFIHSRDLAESIMFIINNSNKNLIINIGVGYDFSISSLAKKIAKIINFKGKIIFDSKKPDGTYQKLLNNNKILNLGWEPKINLDDGIKEMINYYEKKYVN